MIFNLSRNRSESGFISYAKNLIGNDFELKKLSSTDEFFQNIEIHGSIYSSFFQNIQLLKKNNFEVEFFIESSGENEDRAKNNFETKEIEYLFLQFYTALNLVKKYEMRFVDMNRFQINKDLSVKFELSHKICSFDYNVKAIISFFCKFERFKDISPNNIGELFNLIGYSYKFVSDKVYFFKFSDISPTILSRRWFYDQSGRESISIYIKIANKIQKKIYKNNILNCFMAKNILAINIEPNIGDILPYLKTIFTFENGSEPGDPDEIARRIDEFIKGSQFALIVFIIDKKLNKEESDFFNILFKSHGSSGLSLVNLTENRDIDFDITLNEEMNNIASEFLNFKKSITLRFNENEVGVLKLVKVFPLKYSEIQKISKIIKNTVDSLIEDKVIFIQHHRLFISTDFMKQVELSDSEYFEILNELKGFITSDVLTFISDLKESKLDKIQEYLEKFRLANDSNDSFKLKLIKDSIIDNYLKVGKYSVLAEKTVFFLIKHGDFKSAKELITIYNENPGLNHLLKNYFILVLEDDFIEAEKILNKIKKSRDGFSIDELNFVKAIHEVKKGEISSGLILKKKILSNKLKRFFDIFYFDYLVDYGTSKNIKIIQKKIQSILVEFENSNWEISILLIEYLNARVERLKGNYSEAIRNYKKLFFRCSLREIDFLKGNILLQLGDQYYFISEFDQSEYWYRKGIKFFLDSGNKYGIIKGKFSLAKILIISGNWREAGLFIRRKLFYDKENNLIVGMGEDYYQLGKLEFIKKNYNKSLKYLSKSIELMDNSLKSVFKNRATFIKLFKTLVLANVDVGKSKKYFLQLNLSGSEKKEINLYGFINKIFSESYNPEKDLDGIFNGMDSVSEMFIVITTLFPLIRRDILLDKLKIYMKSLSREKRNYYYFDYLYHYFLEMEDLKDSSNESDIEDFEDMYLYFTSNNRMISPHINFLKSRIDEEMIKKDIFKSANLIEKFRKWNHPEDFFVSFYNEIEKFSNIDLISLKLFDKDKMIFSFSNMEKNQSVIEEIVKLTKYRSADLTLSLKDVQNVCSSIKKSLYRIKITKSFIWDVSDRLSGILVLGWGKQEKLEIGDQNRIKRTITEFSELFRKYYEDVYCVNRKMGNIIGNSESMQNLRMLISKVSKVDFSLLINGESGSGKELVARAVHLLSKREKGRFVPVNSASIPENLIESELFGYVKGAFTDAKFDKIGLVESADRGTFFMDEIGELPLNLQAKLLRTIQENEIKRVGENVARKINVRFIFATNKNLIQMIKEGKFREDLYYRIQDLVINVPSLRERIEDIPLLVKYFFDKFGFSIKKSEELKSIIEKFSTMSWKGNVRELESAVKRIITFYPDYGDLRVNGKMNSTGLKGLIPARIKFERGYILKTLKAEKWNKTAAAKELRISRTYLFNLISKYNITETDIN